jgi:hypothetical protein
MASRRPRRYILKSPKSVVITGCLGCSSLSLIRHRSARFGRPVGISYRQFREPRDVVGRKECRPDQPFLHEGQDQTGAAQVKRSLREDRFAGQQWFGDPLRDLQGPNVVEVSSIPECYQKASVRDGLHFREKPLRVERSAGPSTAPARRKNGRLDGFRARSSSIRTMPLRDTPDFRAA